MNRRQNDLTPKNHSHAYALMFIRCGAEPTDEDDHQANLQKAALNGALEALGYAIWDILDIPADPQWSRCSSEFYDEILQGVREGVYHVVACVSWSETALDQATYAALLRACVVGNVPLLDEWKLYDPVGLLRPRRATRGSIYK